MFRNNYFINITRFVLLVLVQVLVFNKLNFLGYINPFVYILFLYWYPIKDNKGAFIMTAFFLGLCIDIFSDTLALHSASAVTIAFIRPTIMRFVFGVNYEFQSFKLSSSTRAQQITFLALLIILHHLVFFSLEIFSFSNILLIIKKTFFTFCGTLVICLLLNSLFSFEKK
ncbi:MAG: rod shape-determining protein MreD [Flavobacteriaceae bacterium]|nr:MAG: rod shape-determining protein MreD [Flavobacteriaceae bacterium]